MKASRESYRAAGVDVEAGYRAVELMKQHVERTRTGGVLSGLGGFGGLFAPNLTGMREPVLVSGTDGVGTKLKIAFMMDKHDTIGIDCVAMCVNDIICAGAAPLFFLDYLAVGQTVPHRVAEIVAGISEGCVQAGCALIGGETAEMPGFYPPQEYDIAGFAVGLVDRADILDSGAVQAGAVVLGLPSSGVHSNGFSLVRKALAVDTAALEGFSSELGMSLGQALLTPTRIYVQPVLAVLRQIKLHSICHITGGGFYENIPRALPPGLEAHIDTKAIDKLPIFDIIAQGGSLASQEMYATFNMGIGMCLMVSPEQADRAVELLRQEGERAVIIGQVRKGENAVVLA